MTGQGYPVAGALTRIGVLQHRTYQWIKLYGMPEREREEMQGQAAEVRRLAAELKLVAEESDIRKKGRRVLCQGVTVSYAFIRAHEAQHTVPRMRRMVSVHLSGYSAWRSAPESTRWKEDQRITGLIKQFWLESGGVRGYRKINDDLRDVGGTCGKHCVHRPINSADLRWQTGYRYRPGQRHGHPSVIAPNDAQQQFDVAEPNRVRVTDIIYIRTHEGWLYLVVVLDIVLH